MAYITKNGLKIETELANYLKSRRIFSRYIRYLEGSINSLLYPTNIIFRRPLLICGQPKSEHKFFRAVNVEWTKWNEGEPVEDKAIAEQVIL